MKRRFCCGVSSSKEVNTLTVIRESGPRGPVDDAILADVIGGVEDIYKWTAVWFGESK